MFFAAPAEELSGLAQLRLAISQKREESRLVRNEYFVASSSAAPEFEEEDEIVRQKLTPECQKCLLAGWIRRDWAKEVAEYVEWYPDLLFAEVHKGMSPLALASYENSRMCIDTLRQLVKRHSEETARGRK